MSCLTFLRCVAHISVKDHVVEDIILLAPSEVRSQSKRPFKKRRFVPCRPIPGHFERRKRPMRDQWSAFRSLILWRRMSKETPRKSCPTRISGSALCNVTGNIALVKKDDKLQKHHKPKRLLRSIRSLFIGEIMPLAFDFTFASKPGGKRPNGRTRVCTTHGRASGGVGSSI